MVRLEKIAYEQLLNNQALKRARVLSTPQKWYNESRADAYEVAAHKLFREGITARIYRALEPFIAKFTYQWYKDYANVRGMALEDYLLFEERELRRCFFFQQVLRQSMHPYQWILFHKRRARFNKVERAVRGFVVPQYLKDEGANRLAADTAQNRDDWFAHVYDNFMSDLTPGQRWSVLPKLIPLDIISSYGWYRHEAWDRYFFNENYYDNYSQEQIQQAKLNPFAYCGDFLSSPSGKKEFEAEVNRFISLYPGSVVKEGDKFNFEEFYAAFALKQGKDTSKLDQTVVARLKAEMAKKIEDKSEEKKSKSKKIIGTALPGFMQSKPKAIQN